MDYSKLVESLKKQDANRKCFDCGVVGTTYASLNFGTFVCSQCAGILRGLNFKVKPLGISIFTLNEYEILQKNGNEKAKYIWMGLFDPYKHEKPDPKNYNDVKKHLIKKYKEKQFFRESKGIHFINKSIEDDIKDPLEFINKCKIKNIEVGPLWTKKNIDPKNDGENNIKGEKSKDNKNQNNNNKVDLLGDLLGIDNTNNTNKNINNNQINDINDLLNGLNFNNENKIEKLNNKLNNVNNDKAFINEKKDDDFGFDFSSFSNNNNSSNKTNIQKKEDIKDENFGFDFSNEKSDDNNKEEKEIKKNNNRDNFMDFNFEQNNSNVNNEKNKFTSDLLDFDFSNNNKEDQNNKQKNSNSNAINNNKGETNILEFNFGENNQNKKQINNIDDNLGFDFRSQSQKENKIEEKKEINNENMNDNLGLNFEFENEKNQFNVNEPQNINSIFEDPNTENINNMKKNQEMQRNDNFQSLTIALDNQNQMDQINQGNFDFSSNNNFVSNNDNQNDKKINFNFDQIMNNQK